jgi:hypothetical protein
MNIYTVRDNLINTIKGKEAYLAKLGSTREMNAGAAMAVEATRNMLKINIDELERILADVEVCCEKATEDSWALNPERMGQ